MVVLICGIARADDGNQHIYPHSGSDVARIPMDCAQVICLLSRLTGSLGSARKTLCLLRRKRCGWRLRAELADRLSPHTISVHRPSVPPVYLSALKPSRLALAIGGDKPFSPSPLLAGFF
ncbi:hypothetical protein BHM03_00034108 [Ensete ventricosum]|nr:hypothetical protein BHM03_00034108 [Ensete ventricosum]